jgi:hypothetical protein
VPFNQWKKSFTQFSGGKDPDSLGIKTEQQAIDFLNKKGK